MKKIYILLVLISVFSIPAFAATGDSTIIVTHDKVVIKTDPSSGSTRYMEWGEFPKSSVNYRKVYLYMEFGCAPGLMCGEWDYINNIYLGRKGGAKGDSLHYELARFITPYGKYWNAASKWKHGWYFDMTDFSYLLHDSLQIIYQHTGYEANNDRGWTVTLKFVCIEGTPALQPMGLNKFFEVSAPYGSASNPFKNQVPDKTFMVPADANLVRLKTTQTGHGMDQQENCSEFCSKQRTIKLDNNILEKKQVWRDNCGMNSLYPQAGTWLYDRAGWCPGAPVESSDLEVGVDGGSQHTFSLDMEAYNNTTGGSANYYISSYAFYFKDNRKQTDAAIDDIIAPSSHLDYLRYNPECGAPIISVLNEGKDTIKTIYFEYGKQGGHIQWIEVHCNIAPFRKAWVNLEAIYDWSGAGNTFYAKILKVNNRDDENAENNLMYSLITNTVTWPNKIVISLKTNNAASENYYRITDSRGRVVLSRTNLTDNTTYRDTVEFFNNICYKFELFDDGPAPSGNPLNKDGLGWWANTGDGTGSLQIRSGLNNALLKNYQVDFGTKITQNFYTTFSMDVPSVSVLENPVMLKVFPNPSRGIVNIAMDFKEAGEALVVVYDNTGRCVYNGISNGTSDELILDALTPGIYHVMASKGNNYATAVFTVY